MLRCHYCIVNNCSSEEYCPPTPLPIPPDYAKKLIERWEMARKGILPPTLKMILKTRYPLPCTGSESSGDDQIESGSFKALADGQEEERSSSLLPCAEPESSGYDQIETDSLEALTDGQEEERWKIPLVAGPNDMTERHRERRKVTLVRVQV